MKENRARVWLKPVLFVAAVAPIGVLLYANYFMAESERAFDEAHCPYTERELRSVTDAASVREEARTCQPDVEEHRWVLLREGEAPLELGRRRLQAHLYDGYTWEATEPEGRVRIEIRNPGHDPRVFREPPADAGVYTPPR